MENSRFVSLRWRLILPVCVLVLVMATTGAYLWARQAEGDVSAAPSGLLLQSRRALEQQARTLFEGQQRAAQTIAALGEVPQFVRDESGLVMRSALESQARRANLDDLLLINAQGDLLLGLRRDAATGRYLSLATEATDTAADVLLADVTASPAVSFAQIAGETLLYVRVPVWHDQTAVGAVLAGHRLPWVLAALQPSELTELALFQIDRQPLVSTLPDGVAPPPDDLEQIAAQEIAGETYRTLYFPFIYGGSTPGTIGVFLSPRAFATADVARQVTALLAAGLAAGGVILIFVALGWMTGQVRRITRVAESLTLGNRTARTNMQPTHEIGRLGHALDQYADYVQERQDTLRAGLRRQRRETERLTAVLESLPDGIIVQDLDGNVLLMNEPAREMLDSDNSLRSTPDLQELTAFATDRLGPALAPGIYTLGEPERIRVNNRVLHVQAAAVLSATQQRIGTVTVLRDVSEEVKLEEAREKILRQMRDEVQEPLSDLAQQSMRPASPSLLTQEVRRHAGSLQKMILEMRDLTDTHLRKVTEEQQRPILLDSLVWSVANEWRQVAQAQNLNLHVILEKSGLYVLGEERRLRWAIGNIVDNAIKYTPPGGDLTLEVRDDISEERAHLRVRDNGVGIARSELPHVFNRFYRGRPTTPEGREIRVAGSGQGLTVARQIFEAHGGNLTLKSRQGVGTAAYFTLPLTSPVSLELPPLSYEMEEETVRIDTRRTFSDSAGEESSQT